uniref:Uncharacterized protein n=1 Tax=Anopheles coluzzii TaxID=1518534 RepID=A0A8W7P0E5_ANOCL
MGESKVGGNEQDREPVLTAGRNGAVARSELDTEYKQHLGLLEQLENVGNMSNGTSGATEDLEQQINSFYFYERGLPGFEIVRLSFEMSVLSNVTDALSRRVDKKVTFARHAKASRPCLG